MVWLRTCNYFLFPEYINHGEVQEIIVDKFYHEFIKCYNGGFFFSRSLIIYGRNCECDFYVSNDVVNKKMNIEYDWISASNFFFACDVFGNQFCFDDHTSEIYLFNIETGNRERIAGDFIEWITILKSETDYFTGQSFIIKWEEVMPRLNYYERLTPKMPFVLGGEYHLSNMRVEKLEKILEFNSNIAKQIKDLPDGSLVNIEIR